MIKLNKTFASHAIKEDINNCTIRLKNTEVKKGQGAESYA